ncbi:MAG: hypothetical protein GX657_00475 [Chloroflexi bacterium]|nr:hypothetical protein [Chloroflexota bacterium]
MRTFLATVSVVLMALAVLTSPVVEGRATAPGTLPGGLIQQPFTSANLLVNGDFEGTFSPRLDPYALPGEGPAGELTLADGWEVWYNNVQTCPPMTVLGAAPSYLAPLTCDPASYNRRPEYQPEEGTFRVRSGRKAQKFFTFAGTHTAGMYQTVRNVPVAQWVSFAVWVQTWSSQLDDPHYSMYPGMYHTYVGIDPTGGRDWQSPAIIWSPPFVRHDRWVLQQVSAYTLSDEITVWIGAKQDWPVKHNDSYWDDASLVVLGGAPTPTRTDTPTPTVAPTPAATPVGYSPPACDGWRAQWQADLGGCTATWRVDAGGGRVEPLPAGISLLNGTADTGAFPLAWVDGHFSPWGDVTLSFEMRFPSVTGYGTGVSVGSRPFVGDRDLEGLPPNPYLHDVLEVHHFSGSEGTPGFTASLLGRRVWTGIAGDSSWHTVTLKLRGLTYTLSIDGQEVGTAVSYWRPYSLIVGSSAVVGIPGRWSEVAVRNARLELCAKAMHLPLMVRGSP